MIVPLTGPESLEVKKARLAEIMTILGPLYPDHKPLLDYTNPFQLLVATVLAAQCTDAAVNLITPVLFTRFPGPAALGEAPLAELETLIHSTGFFRTKARNIKELSRQLWDRHRGEVPQTMEELTALPGVGRKTAGVVLSTFFNVPAIIVDTHFSRVTRRLGLTESARSEGIERDIGAVTPKEQWTAVSQVLNRHGRFRCHARKPLCGACGVTLQCPKLTIHKG
ncbi:MAG: endonuclease III [Treponema sp.]|jgi:endonuclease-3|nr:endonuclease III [Treponema sp.]